MTQAPVHPPRAPAPAVDAARRWTPGRQVGVVAAALCLLVGAVLLVSAAGTAVASAALRDGSGYIHSTPVAWSTPGHAVLSENVHLSGAALMSGRMPHRMMGTVRITATPTAGHPVFLGLARSSDVHRYLADVARSTVVEPWDAEDTRSTFISGHPPTAAPTRQPFWVASASGTGDQTVDWVPRSGDWTLVVMNADGSAPVSADVTVAGDFPIIGVAATVLFVSGLVLTIGAGTGLYLAVPRTRPSNQHQE